MGKTTMILVFMVLSFNLESNEMLDKAMSINSEAEGLTLLEKWSDKKDSEVYKGVIYHNLCSFDLRIDWIEKGLSLLQESYESTGNPLALGYLGSLITIKGNYQIYKNDVIGAVESLKTGGEKIDKAIDLDGDNISLRFLRLINGIEVSESSPMDRSHVVKKDLAYLERRIKELTDNDKSMLYYYKGRFLLKNDSINKGLTSLEKSLNFSHKSTYAKLSRELLYVWEE